MTCAQSAMWALRVDVLGVGSRAIAPAHASFGIGHDTGSVAHPGSFHEKSWIACVLEGSIIGLYVSWIAYVLLLFAQGRRDEALAKAG